MRRLIDTDLFTGLKTYHHFDHTNNKTIIETVQDIEPTLDHCKRLKNDEEYSRQGIKNGMWHYAHIPNIVLHKIYKMGINPYNMNKTEFKRVIKLINTEYPLLKTTTKKHG